MNAEIEPISKEKRKDKVTGMHIRFLDDGTYVLRTDNMDYSKCVEFSYQDMGGLMAGIKKVTGKMEKGESDELGKKY